MAVTTEGAVKRKSCCKTNYLKNFNEFYFQEKIAKNHEFERLIFAMNSLRYDTNTID